MNDASKSWPDLNGLDLNPTLSALHLWSQVVGKIRLMLTPWENHGWHVPLYVSSTGLSTGLIFTDRTAFSIDFDLMHDELVIRDTGGKYGAVPLRPQSVAEFHCATMSVLGAIGIDIQIDMMPCELPGAIRFDKDIEARPYDGDVARTYWRSLVCAQRVFQVFRSGFHGKCSPIHLFWGAFDLAVTRFSGRDAPRHPGGALHMPDDVAREAYSQEVSSAGFWPGIGTVDGPCFYSYAYPAPEGFADSKVEPAAAYFDPKLGEFLLPYGAIAKSPDPDGMLLAFLQTTYAAAADLAQWDRRKVERPFGPLGRPPVLI